MAAAMGPSNCGDGHANKYYAVEPHPLKDLIFVMVVMNKVCMMYTFKEAMNLDRVPVNVHCAPKSKLYTL